MMIINDDVCDNKMKIKTEQKSRQKKKRKNKTKRKRKKKKKTRGPNAKMSYIPHTYRTSLKSSPLHNQQSQTFGLLYATLQLNDCTNSNFPVTLTLNESQGHSNWNPIEVTVDFRHVLHHTKFETNQFTSVPTQATVTCKSYKIM